MCDHPVPGTGTRGKLSCICTINIHVRYRTDTKLQPTLKLVTDIFYFIYIIFFCATFTFYFENTKTCRAVLCTFVNVCYLYPLHCHPPFPICTN